MDDKVHIVETGEAWQVWQQGDSRPLGTYATLGEAEEQARVAAAAVQTEVEAHPLPIDPTEDAAT